VGTVADDDDVGRCTNPLLSSFVKADGVTTADDDAAVKVEKRPMVCFLNNGFPANERKEYVDTEAG
jgi:hypothetical protein